MQRNIQKRLTLPSVLGRATIGMAKKTVIKQALKYAPLKTDFRKALSNDETIKTELSDDMSDIHGEEIWDVEYQEKTA